MLIYIGYWTLNIYYYYYKQLVLLLLSVYSPFSDRVGLPLHNIPSPPVACQFTSVYFTSSVIIFQIKTKLHKDIITYNYV